MGDVGNGFESLPPAPRTATRVWLAADVENDLQAERARAVRATSMMWWFFGLRGGESVTVTVTSCDPTCSSLSSSASSPPHDPPHIPIAPQNIADTLKSTIPNFSALFYALKWRPRSITRDAYHSLLSRTTKGRCALGFAPWMKYTAAGTKKIA